jgi:hypothetical protein
MNESEPIHRISKKVELYEVACWRCSRIVELLHPSGRIAVRIAAPCCSSSGAAYANHARRGPRRILQQPRKKRKEGTHQPRGLPSVFPGALAACTPAKVRSQIKFGEQLNMRICAKGWQS